MTNLYRAIDPKLRERRSWQFKKSHFSMVVQKVDSMTRAQINPATLEIWFQKMTFYIDELPDLLS
jgi:hypothetical protein